MKKYGNVLALGLILFLGSALRLAYLGSMPGGMHQDEVFVAWNAYSLFHDGIDSAGNVFPVYLADWGDGHSALYSWMLIPLIALNGGRITPALSRFPQAFVAILTILAVYFLLKRMFGTRMGLLGAFLLAICPWHVMMSRWGLDANLAPGFLIFGLCFFLKGVEDNRYLLLSALFYGLSLYCYAVIWTIVPVMLGLSIFYCLLSKKLRINRWGLLASALLFLLALPLLLFVLVNQAVLPEIRLPFMTIPAMVGYRGGELALSPAVMWENFRRVGTLLLRQDMGNPYDILLPHGLFYDIGRVFIILGFLCLVYRMGRKLLRHEFSQEVFLLIQLIGGGIVALLVTVTLHQINCLFIPLVLCEAYGVESVLAWTENHLRRATKPLLCGIVLAYLGCLIWFQKDYYTSYRQTVNAYFAKGVEEAVPYAMEQGNDIIVEKGAQWPRILLYSETTGSQYLENVVYSQYPAPASFQKGDITFHIGIDYSHIHPDSVYIIYYTDVETFQERFELTRFGDYWYVAVPKES